MSYPAAALDSVGSNLDLDPIYVRQDTKSFDGPHLFTPSAARRQYSQILIGYPSTSRSLTDKEIEAIAGSQGSGPAGSVRDLDQTFGAVELLLRKHQKLARDSAKVLTQTSVRIDALENYAHEEGSPFSSISKDALLNAIEDWGATRRPFVALLENGNLRAVWKAGREQIAVQFLSRSVVQFVIFVERKNGFISRSSGRDSLVSFFTSLDKVLKERLINE